MCVHTCCGTQGVWDNREVKVSPRKRWRVNFYTMTSVNKRKLDSEVEEENNPIKESFQAACEPNVHAFGLIAFEYWLLSKSILSVKCVPPLQRF